MEIYRDLVELILPDGILDYFELKSFKKEGSLLHIYLEELDIIPEEYSKEAYRNNGFLPEVQVKDFPVRDLFLNLHVKRRRWLLTESGKKVRRDWSLLEPGTRMTKGFATFLKGLAG